MDSPAKTWRRRYERFDRKLGFALGAVVGFGLFSLGAAQGLDSNGKDAFLAGLAGAALLGTAGAIFGDKVLERLLDLLS